MQKSLETRVLDAPEGPAPRKRVPLRGERVLKHGDVFAMFDSFGDIGPEAEAQEGLYHRDTRHLSLLRLTVGGHAPALLSSTVSLDNGALTVDLTLPEIERDGDVVLRTEMVHISRTSFLWRGGAYERIAIRNHDLAPLTLDLDLEFDADFADIFEARGFDRDSRGPIEAFVGDGRARFIYHAHDGEPRTTTLRFDPIPDQLQERRARWRLSLAPRRRAVIFVAVDCGAAPEPPGRALGFFTAIRQSRRPIRAGGRRSALIETSDAVANETFARSRADLTMLTTETTHGAYPFAGVPWFSTAFGRDGLITALLTLWADPALAKGVLEYLAAHQATGDDPASDAEPGKILHETRGGELARIGAIPFHRYYGTIDATPLFVMLAGAYWERTGDCATIERLMPAVERALDWMTRYGDRDGDGLVEYGRRRSDGLLNQGWKDSDDSVSHADGTLADGPIALVEVQGYAFAAWRAAAALHAAVGRLDDAARAEAAAERLREAIETCFWDERLGFYALALDGEKRPCAVRASNAGHLLLCGAVAPERAARVAEALVSPAFFSGYGVRTLAATEIRYNPMSYHNGSIWPHDVALIALGLGRYGLKEAAVKLLDGMLDAARHMELRRLPELFCGFRRPPGAPPTLYPVACSPQAWAAAAPFGLLQAALGLSLDAGARTIRLDRPRLPARLEEVRLRNLRLGEARVDLRLRRTGQDVAVDALDQEGPLDVVVRL